MSMQLLPNLEHCWNSAIQYCHGRKDSGDSRIHSYIKRVLNVFINISSLTVIWAVGCCKFRFGQSRLPLVKPKVHSVFPQSVLIAESQLRLIGMLPRIGFLKKLAKEWNCAPAEQLTVQVVRIHSKSPEWKFSQAFAGVLIAYLNAYYPQVHAYG